MNKEIIELILKDENLGTEQKKEIIIAIVTSQNCNCYGTWNIPWYDPNVYPATPYWGGPVTIASQSPVPDVELMTPEWADKLKTVMTTASGPFNPDDFKGDISSLVEWYKNVGSTSKVVTEEKV